MRPKKGDGIERPGCTDLRGDGCEEEPHDHYDGEKDECPERQS
jgi:hypothetical protein